MKNIEEARQQPGGLNKAWRALRSIRKTEAPNSVATQQAKKAYGRAVRRHEESR